MRLRVDLNLGDFSFRSDATTQNISHEASRTFPLSSFIGGQFDSD
jgi:hypothetical protein